MAHSNSCSAVEADTDYPGNDIGLTRQSDWTKCCDDCRTTRGCKVSVWTAYEGGTCWLKNSNATKATVLGAQAVTVKQAQCQLLPDNTDYSGNDIASSSQANAADCCDDCAGTIGCKVYVWTDYNGGTCWLKDAMGPAQFKFGARSGTPVRPNAQCQPLDKNSDFVGNDIASTQRSSADDCCDDCTATAGCQLYVWTGYNDGTCWLKSGKGAQVPLSGARAGASKAFAPGLCSNLSDDTDYDGNDIGSTSRSNPGQCCDDCERTIGCNLYVWTEHNNGTCWLKDAMGEAKTLTRAKAGLFKKFRPRRTPAPTPSPTP
ncbi:unnamed protein product, partial [Aphanomyces euteiches]